MEEKRKKTKGEKYSTNKLKALRFAYAYLISLRITSGAQYIFACVIVSLVCKTHAYPEVIFYLIFSLCQINKGENVQEVLWQKSMGTFS